MAVEPVIGVARQAFRAIVDIEENGVIAASAGADQALDIRLLDADARIVEAIAENLRHRPPRPGDDRGHELGDDDPRLRAESAERGAQGEAHAEPADEHARPRHAATSAQESVASASSEPLSRLFISS